MPASRITLLKLKEEINRAKTGELVKLKGRFIGYDELFNELRMDQCTIEE